MLCVEKESQRRSVKTCLREFIENQRKSNRSVNCDVKQLIPLYSTLAVVFGLGQTFTHLNFYSFHSPPPPRGDAGEFQSRIRPYLYIICP